MSDPKTVKQPTAEELQMVAGAGCPPEEWAAILHCLEQSHDALVDMASYMIERAGGRNS